MNIHLVSYAQPTATQAVAGALATLFQVLESGTKAERRAAIAAVEAAMEKCPQVEQPLEHQFAPGLYARKIVNPKGSLIATKIHKQANFSFVLRGRLGVITEDGIKTIQAPAFFRTEPGTKRLIFAQEEVEFITVHPNQDNTEDLELLESRIIATDFDEIGGGASCLG